MADNDALRMDPWLYTLIGNLNEPVFFLESNGIIRVASAGAAALVNQNGWDPAVETADNPLRLVHRVREEDLSEAITAMVMAGTGSVVTEDVDLRMGDLLQIPIQGMVIPVRDTGGVVMGGILFARPPETSGPDIDRLLMEFEAIFQSAHSAMFIVAVAGDTFRYLRVNRSREMTAGMTEAESVGRTPRETMGEVVGGQIEARMRECAASGREISYIADRIYPAGRRVFRTVLTPLIIDGRVVEIIGSLHDITDLKVMEETLRESQERYQLVFDNARDGIILYPFVHEGPAQKFADVNPAYEEMTEYTRAELLGLTPYDLLEAGQEQQVQAYRRELSRNGSCFFEFIIRSRTGNTIPVGISAQRITMAADEYVLAVVRDITERKKAEAAMDYRITLEKSITETSRLLLGNELPDFNEILAVLGKGAGVSWAYFFLAQPPAARVHYQDVLPKTRPWEWTAPGLGSLANQVQDVPFEQIGWLLGHLRSHKPLMVEDVAALPVEAAREKELLIGLGARSSLNVPVFIAEELIGFLGFVTLDAPRCWQQEDVELLTTVGRMIGTRIEQRAAQERIRYLSFHDQLTGLYNKGYFIEELKRMDTARQLPLSLIVGDVNGLKLVNDAFGHREGDQLLKKVAESIRRVCRQEDLISRWGGDEFVVLLPSTDLFVAEEIAERIRQQCEKEDNAAIRVTMAMGTATKTDEKTPMDDVIRTAEEAMYRRKIRDSVTVRSTIMSSLQNKLVAEGYEEPSHWERLRELSEEFASVLDLGVSELEELTLLCYLHDIGKLAVAADVLRKEGPWTPDEEKQAQKHVEAGYRIALASPQLTSIAEDILSHHEHWDGKGYPRGLTGREIPYISRVFAIINAYEHLTQNAQHKPALQEREALQQIQAGGGRRFDPELAEIFVRWQTSGKKKSINN